MKKRQFSIFAAAQHQYAWYHQRQSSSPIILRLFQFVSCIVLLPPSTRVVASAVAINSLESSSSMITSGSSSVRARASFSRSMVVRRNGYVGSADGTRASFCRVVVPAGSSTSTRSNCGELASSSSMALGFRTEERSRPTYWSNHQSSSEWNWNNPSTTNSFKTPHDRFMILASSSSSSPTIQTMIRRDILQNTLTTRLYSTTASTSLSATTTTSTSTSTIVSSTNDAEEHDKITTPLTPTTNEFTTTEGNWRNHPALTESFDLPSITVPSRHVHTLLSSGDGNNKKGGGGGPAIDFAPFLASHNEEMFRNVHPRIKLVRDIPDEFIDADGDPNNDDGSGRKAILLDPATVFATMASPYDTTAPPSPTPTPNTNDDANHHHHLTTKLQCHFDGINDITTISHLASLQALPGPTISITVDYKRQTIGRILSKVLPKSVLPPPTGFEQNGHVVHMNLRTHHLPYKHLIGSILLDRLSPNVQTIVNKVGQVSGQYRTFDMELLSTSKPSTVVTLHEAGIRLTFDLRNVYWCTRLATERERVLEEMEAGQIVADAFCGVGAVCILAARAGCRVLANDLNPDAVQYCRTNAKANGVSLVWKNKAVEEGLERVDEEEDGTEHGTKRHTTMVGGGVGGFDVGCGDAFDFLQDLGTTTPSLPHHVLMNYPPDSASFLGALRWWPASRLVDEDIIPLVHLYIFARDDDDDGVQCNADHDHAVIIGTTINDNDNKKSLSPLRNATEVAIDMVADGLIPEGGAIEKTIRRENYLNSLGCNVRVRDVRDVAPGKAVVYVSFRVTADLIRTMQGDFLEG